MPRSRFRSNIASVMMAAPSWDDRAKHTNELVAAALSAAAPHRSVHRYLRRDGDVLCAGNKSYRLSEFRRVLVVGFGKAAVSMGQACQTVLGDYLLGGIILTKYGLSRPLDRIEVIEAGHPLPDAASVRGAQRMLSFVGETGPDDLIIALVSGGGSALLTLPVEGVSLAELQSLNIDLLRSGATIHQINTIRKHLSQVKGGNLAHRFAPARVVTLILSDVVGNDLDVIASGPLSPDPTTFATAWETLTFCGLQKDVLGGVISHLKMGLRGEIPETPKNGDPVFERVQTLIVGDNGTAAAAVERRAITLGFEARMLATPLEGEARKVARDIVVEQVKKVATDETMASCPRCLVMGGETTVTICGVGKGGRNQELALAVAIGLDEISLRRVRLVCLATDGEDGPTEAAGAVADSDSVARAARLGLDAMDYLARNDSFPFFAALDNLIMTNPTGTNVNDLVIALMY